MIVNSTEKPNLPDDLQLITEYSILISITSTKTLTEVARLLRETYYFYCISDSWIKIHANPTEVNEPTNNLIEKPIILDEIDKILTYLKNNNIDTTQLILLITTQKSVSETLSILHQYFTIKTIPSNILDLPPLPEPTWGIFSQQQ
ncbi:872_t:CDS:1 [Ambispora leptoticha]|uniref:872_t:CDS:1 n=1 Tax=Ambispora leptoticha TaxID=144679 RepID=A0A9N9DQ68_9GLOM|nr:872_t:CDS:1 [Ambispora leptoticha]